MTFQLKRVFFPACRTSQFKHSFKLNSCLEFISSLFFSHLSQVDFFYYLLFFIVGHLLQEQYLLEEQENIILLNMSENFVSQGIVT